jgi:hypothetical protein
MSAEQETLSMPLMGEPFAGATFRHWLVHCRVAQPRRKSPARARVGRSGRHARA